MFEIKVHSLIEKLLADSCRELFSVYGVELADAEPFSEAELLLCGVIGFVSERLRGTCILLMTEAPLRRSNPLPGSDRDWLAELTNQLVGRLKNKLLQRGVEVYVTLPVILRGERIAPLAHHPSAPSIFSCGDGLVFLWADVDSTLDELPEANSAASLSLEEGDALLF